LDVGLWTLDFGPFFIQLSQLDLVIFAKPVGETVTAMGKGAGFQLVCVSLLLLRPPGALRFLKLFGADLPLLSLLVAVAGEQARLALGSFLVEIPAGQVGLCLEHRSLALLLPAPGHSQLTLALLAFLAALAQLGIDLGVPCPQRLEAFFDL